MVGYQKQAVLPIHQIPLGCYYPLKQKYFLTNAWVLKVGNTANTPNPPGLLLPHEIEIFFNKCLGAESRQYCQFTKSPWVIILLQEALESPQAKENFTSVGFEPTTSRLDLLMLYRLSYEASTGAGRGNLGSESW